MKRVVEEKRWWWWRRRVVTLILALYKVLSSHIMPGCGWK